MAVADDVEQFLTRANLLLNWDHRKIQDDPGENFRDEFQLVKLVEENLPLLEGSVNAANGGAENHSHEIRLAVLRACVVSDN